MANQILKRKQNTFPERQYGCTQRGHGTVAKYNTQLKLVRLVLKGLEMRLRKFPAHSGDLFKTFHKFVGTIEIEVACYKQTMQKYFLLQVTSEAS